MKKLYNLVLVALYAVVACFVGGALVNQVFVYDLRQTITVVFLWIISVILLGVHYYMWCYGNKKRMLSPISVAVLCAVDLFAFGLLFTIITLFTNPVGVRHMLELVMSFELDSHIYRLLILFLLLRSISAIWFFKNNKKGQGDGSPVSRNG